MQIFGARLREMREKRGWMSAYHFARDTKIPYETVYRSEKGTHKAPQLDMLCKLARVLNTSIDYLAGLTDDPRPYKRSFLLED